MAARSRRPALVGASLIQLGWALAPAKAQLLYDAQTVAVPPEPPLTNARSIFARGGDVGVADRALPAFSATGFTLGAFDLYPGLPVEGLYDCNVFANDRRESDEAIVVRPELTARTSAGPYQFEAYGRGNLRHYVSHDTESTEEVLGDADGSIAIGALSSVSAGISYGSLIDPRTPSDSPVEARKPLEYRDLAGFAGATIEGADTRLVLRAASALPNEGKTTAAIGLARILAMSGTRTVLVDADLRRPNVANALGLRPKTGLQQVLDGQATLADALLVDEESGLVVLPMLRTGTASSSTLHDGKFEKLLLELKQAFEIVVLDASPVLPVVDGRLVAKMADATVLLARWRVTPDSAVEMAAHMLASLGVSARGVALTRIDLNALARSSYGDPAQFLGTYSSYCSS